MERDYIYRKRLAYTLLKPVVDWNLRHSYRKVEVIGEENLPSDGPIIFAANHCNTLMDALVILRASRSTTVFGARADMFNSPFLARIMHFLRILPMVRQRDGLRNVLKRRGYATDQADIDAYLGIYSPEKNGGYGGLKVRSMDYIRLIHTTIDAMEQTKRIRIREAKLASSR